MIHYDTALCVAQSNLVDPLPHPAPPTEKVLLESMFSPRFARFEPDDQMTRPLRNKDQTRLDAWPNTKLCMCVCADWKQSEDLASLANDGSKITSNYLLSSVPSPKCIHVAVANCIFDIWGTVDQMKPLRRCMI